MTNDITRTEFLSKANFSDYIENMVLKSNLTYFEAIIEFSEESDKDPEELVPYMSSVLLDKVRKSATDSGLHKENVYDLEDLM